MISECGCNVLVILFSIYYIFNDKENEMLIVVFIINIIVYIRELK